MLLNMKNFQLNAFKNKTNKLYLFLLNIKLLFRVKKRIMKNSAQCNGSTNKRVEPVG